MSRILGEKSERLCKSGKLLNGSVIVLWVYFCFSSVEPIAPAYIIV